MMFIPLLIHCLKENGVKSNVRDNNKADDRVSDKVNEIASTLIADN